SRRIACPPSAASTTVKPSRESTVRTNSRIGSSSSTSNALRNRSRALIVDELPRPTTPAHRRFHAGPLHVIESNRPRFSRPAAGQVGHAVTLQVVLPNETSEAGTRRIVLRAPEHGYPAGPLGEAVEDLNLFALLHFRWPPDTGCKSEDRAELGYRIHS